MTRHRIISFYIPLRIALYFAGTKATSANINAFCFAVNPDVVASTRKSVAQIEQRILMDSLTGKGRADTEDYSW